MLLFFTLWPRYNGRELWLERSGKGAVLDLVVPLGGLDVSASESSHVTETRSTPRRGTR